MNLLKFFLFLSLGLWLGAIVFFTAGEAPTILRLAPTRELGGAIINQSMVRLHNLGFACGVIFLIASLGLSRLQHGELRAAQPSNIFIVIMLALTLYSQLSVLPAIAALRVAAPTQQQLDAFMHLHTVSVALEGAVLLLGFLTLWLALRRLQ